MTAPRPDPIALWYVPVADLGGVARHVLDASRAGIPGWRLFVLCPEGPLAERLRAERRPVLTGPCGPDAGVRASVATVRHTIRSLQPKVVHSHLAYADIVAALATPRAGVGLVSTEHGIAPDDSVYHGSGWTARLMARAHQARATRFDALIAVCRSTRDVMEAKWHVRRPITVVLNGVDRPADATPRPGLRVASLARLAPEKGLDALVAAFTVVHREHPDATLTIAGSGPLLPALRAEVERRELDGCVSFPGYVDADRLLGESDVVAQLSVWENCSYTLLDACAAGLGVAATPVGGNPEILPARCLVSAADTDAVAAAIIDQGMRPARRPGLPGAWPTVDAMTAQIADVYRGIPRD